MRALAKVARRFVAEERAAEVTELAIVLALLIAGTILLIGAIGIKVAQGYADLDGGIP